MRTKNKIIDLKQIQKLKKQAEAAYQKKQDDQKKAVILAEQERASSVLNNVQKLAEQAATENANSVRVMKIEASDCAGYYYRDDVDVIEGAAKIVADKLKDNGVVPYVKDGYLRFDFFPNKK